MNINWWIQDRIKNKLPNYRCSISDAVTFLSESGSFQNKQDAAGILIESIMENHGKGNLLALIAELAKVESGIQELQPWQRDHVVHAVLTYFLGILLNEYYLDKKVSPFQWEISGLFHDVGYPIPIGEKIVYSYTNTLNKIAKKITSDPPTIRPRMFIEGIDELSNDVNSFDVIQNCLCKWKMNIDAISCYQDTISHGTHCHGIVSCLSILWLVDLMYQENNPNRKWRKTVVNGVDYNQKYFVEDIIPSCAAIFIHNLPAKYFVDNKINQKMGLPFLLILADILQEWERPSQNNEKGYSANKFEFLNLHPLKLKADIPCERKNKMLDEISGKLEISEINIM